MRITIECNSLEELKDMIDTLYVLFPEGETEKVKEQQTETKKRNREPRINREKVQELMEQGLTNKEIAAEMGCAYSTICSIVSEINAG